MGVRLYRPWIDARAEFENEKVPLRASFWAISGLLTLSRYGKGSWGGRLHGSHRFQQYTDSDQQVSRLTLGVRAHTRVTRRGLVEIEADYRRERWQGEISGGANDIDALDVRTEFTWWYGAIEVKAEGRLWTALQPRQNEIATRFGLRVRREF